MARAHRVDVKIDFRREEKKNEYVFILIAF